MKSSNLTAVVEAWEPVALGAFLHLAWGHADKPTTLTVFVTWQDLDKVRARQVPLFPEVT